MGVFEKVKEIVNGFEVRISSAREMLGFCKGNEISFKSALDREGYSDIIPKFNSAFGEPIFVDPYYGFVWKVDGKIITFGCIGAGYDYSEEMIYVFNRMPWGKKIKYSKYKQIDDLVKQIICEHNFEPNFGINYYFNTFFFSGNAEDRQCIISIKKKTLFCYFSKKEPLEQGMTKLKPQYNVKKTVNLDNLEELKETIEECLDNAEFRIKN